jgi:hypothetical protein
VNHRKSRKLSRLSAAMTERVTRPFTLCARPVTRMRSDRLSASIIESATLAPVVHLA